jgi:spore coat-associated protein N
MTMRSTCAAHHRLVLGASVMVVAVVGVTTLATSALFTDTAAVTAGAFTTGTVSLTSTYPTTTLALANMAPGDTVWAPITVANDGSLPLRYSMASVTTGDVPLAAALQLSFKTVAAAANCNSGGWGAGVALVGGGVGPVVFGSAGGTPIIGSVAVGNQTTDQTLANGTNHILCAQVFLPTSWSTQSVTSSATFTFTGEQTTNNP